MKHKKGERVILVREVDGLIRPFAPTSVDRHLATGWREATAAEKKPYHVAADDTKSTTEKKGA